MPPLNLTSEQIATLVGSRHPIAEYERPALGLQPYYEWLVQSLEQLGDACVGQLRVSGDSTSDLHVYVAEGSVRFGASLLAVPAQSLDLAAFDDKTALIAVEESGGAAVVSTIDSATDWPTGDHLKLAEVTIFAGEITDIVDRRLDPLFTAGS